MKLACQEMPRCANCNSHFQELRPLLREAAVSKHFKRDIKDDAMIKQIVEAVLDCRHTDFTELHKFEEHIGQASVFRAKRNHIHYVYAVKGDKILFLRALGNFKEYERFLKDKKGILHMVEQEHF